MNDPDDKRLLKELLDSLKELDLAVETVKSDVSLQTIGKTLQGFSEKQKELLLMLAELPVSE